MSSVSSDFMALYTNAVIIIIIIILGPLAQIIIIIM